VEPARRTPRDLWGPAASRMVSGMYPFERFTQRAKQVLTLAQEEAERSHHSYIGTEHLLLGVLRVTEGAGARVLGNLGVEIGQVRSLIDRVQGRDERLVIQQIIPTTRVKRVIEIAFEEARRLERNYVGTEHLLLALIIEGDGIAAHVLQDVGASQERVRAEIDGILHEARPEGGGPGAAEPSGRAGPRPSSGAFGPTGAGRPVPTSWTRMRPPPSPAFGEIEEEAGRLAAEQHATLGPEHILLAALETDPLVRRMLAALGIDAARIAAARRIATPPDRLLELRRAYQAKGIELGVWRGGPLGSPGMPEMAEPPGFRATQADHEEFERLRAELEEAERRWRAGDDAAGSSEPGSRQAAP